MNLREKQLHEQAQDKLMRLKSTTRFEPGSYPIAKLFPDSIDYLCHYSEYLHTWVEVRELGLIKVIDMKTGREVSI